MLIKIETAAYNERRYGKPWIAKVQFDAAGKAEYIWGDWVGQPGSSGCLVIDVAPGDVVARGQKDHRGRQYPHNYYVVQADGCLGDAIDKATAYAYYSGRSSESVAAGDAREALVAERERLQARIAEINALLGEEV